MKTIPLNENFRSNDGIVSAARRVIESNPQRLSKRMESAGAQPFDRGDMLALSFDAPTDEAQWIAERIRSLYSTEYRDKPDADPRGLAYSDFAVLLRSVRRDAEPIINALTSAEVPFVVGGMNKLFDTPEIQAVRKVFYYMAGFVPRDSELITLERLNAGSSMWL